MYRVKTLPEFDAWLKRLGDGTVRLRLVTRLRKASLGNLGDVRPVGAGVFEMRTHFGAGWRMYYIRRGRELIVMLGGGDKSSQKRDIKRAIEMARALKKE
jgi:putative addiction module killer protein